MILSKCLKSTKSILDNNLKMTSSHDICGMSKQVSNAYYCYCEDMEPW